MHEAVMPNTCEVPVTEVIPDVPYPDLAPMPEGQRRWQEGDELPFPDELARRPADFELIKRWCREYKAESDRVFKGNRAGRRAHRFDYKNVVGGKDGITLHNFLKDEYMGHTWSCIAWIEAGGDSVPREQQQPCTPMQPHDAGAQSEWRLDRISADAAACNYQDKDLIDAVTKRGFRSHSAALYDNTVMLVPNYGSFWPETEFARVQTDMDRFDFARPRVTGGWTLFPPYLVCRVHPRSVAVTETLSQSAAGGGEVAVLKRRICLDPGCPRPPHGRRWGPHESIAWNDMINLEDRSIFPKVRYPGVDAFAKTLAILRSSGIPVAMVMDDMRGYYRMFPRYWREVPFAMLWVDGKGMCQDWALCFGESPNVQWSQRMSTFFLFKVLDALLGVQRQWRTGGLVPLRYRARLDVWEDARRAQRERLLMARRTTLRAVQCKPWEEAERMVAVEAAGMRTATPWWGNQVYIDDVLQAAFTFFAETVAATAQTVFDHYNVELADGRPCFRTGKPTKDKHRVVLEDGEAEILGIEIAPCVDTDGTGQGKGVRRLTELRAEKYALAGELLVGCKRTSEDYVTGWMGRMHFASSALPELRPLTLKLLATLQPYWAMRGTVALSPASWEVIQSACTVLRANVGSALWPCEEPLGMRGRPVVHVHTDAARNLDARPSEFVGWGGWVYVEETDTIFIAYGRWTRYEQERLCITSLELHAQTCMLEIAQQVLQASGFTPEVDVLQVTDNKGSRDVASGISAHSPALRVLLAHRAAQMAERPQQRVVNAHCLRELGDECDDLSKGHLAEAITGLHQRFGFKARVVLVDSLPREQRLLDEAIAATVLAATPKCALVSAKGRERRRERDGGEGRLEMAER